MNEKLVKASVGKRILSHLIDLACVTLPALLIFNFVTSNYYEKAIGAYRDMSNAYSFLGDSGLFNTTEKDGYTEAYAVKSYYATIDESKNANSSDGTVTVQTENGYALYLKDTYNYYRNFLPIDTRIDEISDSTGAKKTASEYYTSEYFYTTIFKFKKAAEVDVASETSRAGTNQYFMYALKDGAVDQNALPVLQTAIQEKVTAGDKTTLTNLKAYFYNEITSNSYSGIFYDAAANAIGQSYFTNSLASYNVKAWTALVVAVAPLILVFYLLIPLLKRNDETIGKMITGLAVVDEDGYSVKGAKKILHPVLMTFEVLLFLIYPLLIGIMVFMLISLLDYMSSIISKSGQSFHEKIAHTRVIDAKKSIWFASPEAEENYIATHPEVYKAKAASSFKKTTPEEASAIAAEDSILDLSTLEKSKAEVDGITNFDEYEKKKDEELSKKSEKTATPKTEEKKVESVKPATPDESGFTDEEKK
jgi:uncharacterized RDD family membrane protein YckC